ncbi:class I SAM-dependent methyltransferase [bacterium]|nr:MAG: class I SAM-dependent methyltransferase [bacterium]
MSNQQKPQHFGKGHASAYDKQWEKVASITEALHLLIRIRLSGLPDDANILCVGAGTGSEILYLANAFPGWTFTAVEPASSMLEVCRHRAEEAGIAARCTFHEGYLDSLPPSAPFHAATCLLVSQFILKPEERRHFFCQIAERLLPGGCLVSADLSSGASHSNYDNLMDVWLQFQSFRNSSGPITPEERQKSLDAYKNLVAVSPPREVEELIASSGFDAPVLFFQALLIHAWYTTRTS